jgi:glycosyltransferase involved in cell wall biosynthesis
MSALFAAGDRGVPVVSSFHTNFHTYGKHYGYGFFIDIALAYLRFLHNRTAVSFAPSRDLIEALRADGFERLELLGRGVDTALFHPGRRDPALRAQWGLKEGEQAVVYVGRLAPEKNIPFLVRTFEAMRARQPRLHLVLVGDGPLRARLEREHPGYHFAGMRHGEDLARHYASGDLFLFPSVTETFGNVVTEAMASGLAVLAYDYAAPGRYIDNDRNGFLVPFEDAEAFRERALALAEAPEKLGPVREAAAASMAALSWDHIIDHYEQTVRGVLERSVADAAWQAL